MTVSVDGLAQALAAIERQYPGSVISGDFEAPPIERVSTGSLELDWATGGGIPIGRRSHVWGSYSAGKSLICWNVIKNAQRAGMTAAYYNIEKQFDASYVKSLGVDMKNLHVIQGSTIEGVGAKLETLLGVINVHVIDSISSAVSIDELAAKLEDWQIGLQSRAWGKVLRRANERFSETENVLIIVNQARDNFKSGEKAPGGRFIEHLSDCTIHFRRGPWLFRDKHGYLSPEGTGTEHSLSGDSQPSGFEIICRVEKSRVGSPLRPARMRYDFDKRSFDDLYEFVKAGKFMKIISTAGGWYTLPNGERVHGEGKLRDYLQKDIGLRAEIKEKLMGQGSTWK